MQVYNRTDPITLRDSRDNMHVPLMTSIRFNRYDAKFMANIHDKYLRHGTPLSHSQNELYEKIVRKYRKQFKRLKLNFLDVLALPWENGIVSHEALTGQTFFCIDEDNLMRMYFNFNKSQIAEMRAIIHDDKCNHLRLGTSDDTSDGFGNGQKYEFTWDNKVKEWAGPFNLYLFKQLYKFAQHARIQIEPTVTDLVSKIEEYGTQDQWSPGMHIVHGRIYINHISESMLPILDEIDLADLSISNIEEIAKLGLAAPAKYRGIGQYISSSPKTTHILKTAEDVSELKDYVTAINRKVVFHIRDFQSAAKPGLVPRANFSSLPTKMIARADQQYEQLSELLNCTSWCESKHFYDFDAANGTNSVDVLEDGYRTLVTTTPLTEMITSQSALGKFALTADKVIYIDLQPADIK